jgi:hypothetical protein
MLLSPIIHVRRKFDSDWVAFIKLARNRGIRKAFCVQKYAIAIHFHRNSSDLHCMLCRNMFWVTKQGATKT